jgi:hypothetical protein
MNMATRSAIGMQNKDGSVTAVYCHWDGYPEHNGAILLEHYGRGRTRKLLALGDLSSLGPNIGEKHAFSVYDLTPEQRTEHDALHRDSCTFYGRDRGETGIDAKTYASITDYMEDFAHAGIDYFYLLVNDAWQVRPAVDGGRWEDLANLLINSAEEMV